MHRFLILLFENNDVIRAPDKILPRKFSRRPCSNQDLYTFIIDKNPGPVFSKCFAVGAALPRVSVETDAPCNLGSLRKSPAPTYFRKILTLQTPDNAFSSLFRREKSLIVLCHFLELTITVYIEHFLLETL